MTKDPVKIYWVVQYLVQGTKSRWSRTVSITSLDEAIEHCKRLNNEVPEYKAHVIRCEYYEHNELVLE